MKVITIGNQKGGCGKTSTAQHLSVGLGLKGYKVLAIDMDSQGNLSRTFGISSDGPSAFNVMCGLPVKDAIVHTEQHIDLVRGEEKLGTLDITYANDLDAPYILGEKLQDIENDYDFVVIDTPPDAQKISVINSLTASDYLIIPVQANVFAIDGLTKIYNAYRRVKARTNPKIKPLGMLLNRCESSTILLQDVAEQLTGLSERLDIPLFKTTIRKAVILENTQWKQGNLFDNHPTAPVTQDYKNLVDEFLKMIK